MGRAPRAVRIDPNVESNMNGPRLRRMKRRATGFSLLELLVAIAIISGLTGILLPALSEARRTGFTARCGSNQRQLGVGWSIHADQNNGAIVPGRPGKFSDASRNAYWVGNGYQYRPRWFVRIGAECGFFAFRQPSTAKQDDNRLAVDGNDVFLCPQAPERVNNRNYTYGYNHQFLGNTRYKG
ncbi:MAG: type II secretion system protein [Phycisphaerae bacterium]